MLEKIEKIEVPPERKLMRLRLPEVERSGRVVLELENIHKSYGDIMSSTERTFSSSAESAWLSSDRTVLESPHSCACSPGAKMSTLESFVSDTMSRRAISVKNVNDLDEERTVLENMTDGAPTEMIPRLRSLLGAFLFPAMTSTKK